MTPRVPKSESRPVWQDAEGVWHVSPIVAGVTVDSRTVTPGSIFVAVRGSRHDGRLFVPDAVARGAVAVVAETPVDPCPVPLVLVPSARRAAAEIAAAYHGHPARALTVVGVTGTNGKTSVVFWLQHVLSRSGYRAGLISSVRNWTGRGWEAASLTTPDAPAIQAALAAMRDNGLSHAVLEVSSHGLVQQRVAAIPFRVAVLTNITREHLDYHGSMEAYIDAKSLLFTEFLDAGGTAVLNADDPYAAAIQDRCRAALLSYGMVRGTIRARLLEEGVWHSRFEIREGRNCRVTTIPVPGRFNVYNALATYAAARALGIPPVTAAEALTTVPPVPGRLEIVAEVDGVTIVVDYAHTPDGLTQALQTARRLVRPPARLWLIFGARGGRDRGKRPIMGAVAGRLADRVVLTSDSPNDEDPEAIARELATGLAESGRTPHRVELDRARAIRETVWEAEPGDAILITGRGPETLQRFGASEVRIVDEEVAQQAARERARRQGTDVGAGRYCHTRA